MRALLPIALLVACHDGGTPPPATARVVDAAVVVVAPKLDAAPAPAPLRDPHRWDCAKDDDCVNSCEWGAVSATWYQQASKRPDFDECEDGCANQLSAPARCEAGACVSYVNDPRDPKKVTKDPGCTHREP